MSSREFLRSYLRLIFNTGSVKSSRNNFIFRKYFPVLLKTSLKIYFKNIFQKLFRKYFYDRKVIVVV
eukprot:TRINITY_DN1015_c0_g1_i2.p1 TRINITY_DN1015_c0_g1~~TRINITY_DN1015_c0_g1_i2.p1  ORF type:complete len:67 (-),score=6.04 TRINITY_DN1015_c0_g1_i2:15-215(-)